MTSPASDSHSICGLSHAGKYRRENQDAFLINQTVYGPTATDEMVITDQFIERDQFVTAVIDGMGGAPGGKAAASWVAECWSERSDWSSEQLLSVLAVDHQALLTHARGTTTSYMGAAAIGAFVQGRVLTIFHAGDCRAYWVGGASDVDLIMRDHFNSGGYLAKCFGGGELPDEKHELVASVTQIQ